MATEQNKLYRYPGTKPFEAADYTLFKGRDEDIKNLFDFVFMENPVVLFSRSGLGKSSLLNAGLSKKITDENKAIPLFIRFGAYTKETKVLPLERLKEEIIKVTEQKQNVLFEKLKSQIQSEQHDLWSGFKHIQMNDPGKHCFVLIFDQFEELFTYPQDAVDRFKRELSELMYTKVPQQLRDFISEKRKTVSNYFTKEETELIFIRLDIRILFAIRSDKLSLLNSLTDVFPTVLKYCYELKPLTEDQAKQAILFPAQLTGDDFESPPFAFTEEALTHILDSLTGTTDPAKTLFTAEKPEIETFQLQIVCKYAENLVIEKGLKEVTKQDLGDIKHIFEDQYNNIISKLPQQQQLPARLMMEDKLIVEQTRVSMPVISLLKDFEKQGMTTQLIEDLINTHVIRRDQSGSIEISHDTLVAPILKAKKEREDKEELARLEAERQEELRQQREKAEKEKLELAKTRKRLQIVYSILGVAVLALIAAGYFGIASNNAKIEANRQKDIAQNTLDRINKFQEKSIGRKYQGGIIFYSDSTREHGLIAAEQDLPGLYTWDSAKIACEAYSVTVDGVTYDDWHLPSKDTLSLLYFFRSNVGGFKGDRYWSSTKSKDYLFDNENGAWLQGFQEGGMVYALFFDTPCNVRAIRSF